MNRQQNRPKIPITTVPKKEIILVLPYLGVGRKIVTKQLKISIRKFYGCEYLRVIFQSAHHIKSPTKIGSTVPECLELFIKLGKQVGERVVVKSFAGATSSEMTHYIQPTLERKPQRIVLHIGTNDLRNSSPEKVADNLVDLAREIEMKSDAKVIISALTTRTDKLSDESAVKSTNKRLRRFCNQNNWKLIQHNNITKQGLNKGGLHLNEAGN